MIKISDKYSWSDICSFTEEDMTKLLSFYASGGVPTLAQLRPDQEGRDADKEDLFDGSFGFSVGS
jgi:precorrin-2 dehydrogenase/sirohydrochlorin ferrochelatase